MGFFGYYHNEGTTSKRHIHKKLAFQGKCLWDTYITAVMLWRPNTNHPTFHSVHNIKDQVKFRRICMESSEQNGTSISNTICPTIHYFYKSHNTAHFGGLFALKQWISSSLKHETVPRVNNFCCFYVKNPQNVNCIMANWENSLC